MKPSIQFTKRQDGVKLAYSRFGKGVPLVCPAPWVTSLSCILEDSFAHNFWEQLSQKVEIILYDKHGCGQSDRNRQDFSLESELSDLETVIHSLKLDKFHILGSSMAGPTAITYSYRNPEKIIKLILYGSYAKGQTIAKDKIKSALISLIKASWGLGSKTLADIFIPGADTAETQSFEKFQKKSSSREVAARLMELSYTLDVTELLPLIKTPTLILHRDQDRIISLDHGRHLASEIQNANFKLLQGNIHPWWLGDTEEIIEEILTFLCGEGHYEAIKMSTEQKTTRKLSAILSADVKGYSLLMADDEVQTIQTLKAYRLIMSDLIQKNSGRVVDSPGDNLLAEFSSAVEAVECAVQIQNRLQKENAKLVEDKRLEFRIGVNIGDVVHDGDRIYGSGVNVASRIEGLTDPGGICISRNTYDHVKDKLELGFEYLGEHEVKNIKEPVRVYKVILDSDSPVTLVTDSLELPDIPSIAVLPFVNMSGDPKQEYFSDGLTEQIINGVSKIRNLFVIARNSAFSYKGKAVKVQQVGQELGVGYVLEGSVQKSGERVRVTAQLIDAKTGYHLWSENYDRDLKDIFVLQDEITIKVIDALHLKLIEGEQWRQWEGGTSNLSAFTKLLQGLEYVHKYTQGDNSQARYFFEEAIKLDTDYAIARAFLGFTHLMDIWFRWSKSPLESFERADNAAKEALELNDSLELAHTIMGQIYLAKRQHDKAIEEGERAIALNPNGSMAYSFLGNTLRFSGRPEEALKLTKKAIRLNPIPPTYFISFLAHAYRDCGQSEDAIKAYEEAVQQDPDYLIIRIGQTICYSLFGPKKEARKAAKEVLRIDPNFSVEWYELIAPFKNKSDLDRGISALRKAGLK